MKPANVSMVCTGCNETKGVTEFHKRASRPSGRVSRCKECTNTAQSALQKTEDTRLYNRKDKLWRNFGLTLEAYDKLLKDQNGVCAICKGPERFLSRNGFPKHMAVDHCHKTGRVRGLLCHHCNTGIGNLNDSVELLKDAIRYLEKHEAEGNKNV